MGSVDATSVASLRKVAQAPCPVSFDWLGRLDLCDVLTLFAVNGRCPGDLPEVRVPLARIYFESARGVRSHLLEQIRA